MKLADFNLTGAEARLVAWLQSGDRRVCEISPGVPAAPGDAVTLRATFVRYLALGGCDACRLPATGLRVQGAWIEGDERKSGGTHGLDLEGATLAHDLALLACHIPDDIFLLSARLKNLFLNDSQLGAGLLGDRLHAEGGVFLRGAKVAGEVRLLGAWVGGNLDCDGAELLHAGNSLSFDRIEVEGVVVLRCAKVAGAIRLLGARVGSDLTCAGAELQHKGNALSCDGIQVAGHVFLTGATVTGAIRLLGARVARNLDCVDARLNGTPVALQCDAALVRGVFFLREGAQVKGTIDLTAASIGAISDDPDCWPENLKLDRCRYGASLGRAPTDADSRLDWLSRIPCKPGEFWPDPYEHCAKVLREMGHSTDARDILIAKERLQRAARRERLRQRYLYEDALWFGLWDHILGATVSYRRRPLLAAA